MSQLGFPELLLLVLAIPAFLLFAYLAGRVCRKAGFSPWLAGALPIANFFLLVFLAYADWPRTRNGPPN